MVEFDPVLVHEWLRRSARRVPQKDAIVCGPDRWSYRRLDAYSDRFAAALLDMGVRRQERVIILTGNCPETVVSLYGTLKAAGVFVVLEAGTKAHRLRYILGNSGARVVVARAEQAPVLQEATAGLDADVKIVWVGGPAGAEAFPAPSGTHWDSLFSVLPDGNGHLSDPQASGILPACVEGVPPSNRGPEALDTRGRDVRDTIHTHGRDAHDAMDMRGLARCIDIDLAALIYTSATTGDPKGVMCTHHNMISAARSIIQYVQNHEDDIILDALPLSFDYGLYQVLMAVMFGGTVVLEPSFVYLHNLLNRVAAEKVTGLPLVPTMAAMLLKMRDLSRYDLSSLRYLTNTGAALPVAHIQALRRLLPQVRVFSMFGLTECKRVGYLDPSELDRRPGSVGRAMPNCEVLIVDEQGREVGPGQVGELIIRGSNVMQGYWRDPEMTAKAYRAGPYPAARWLYSGDHFRRDEEGFLYFLGRKDDMIKTRGERVSPKEVENALCELEDVAEAAVIGVPDEVLGQAIKAFVVTRTGCLDEKMVRRHCADRLSPFMVPQCVEFVAALPKSVNGKIDKRSLQAVKGN